MDEISVCTSTKRELSVDMSSINRTWDSRCSEDRHRYPADCDGSPQDALLLFLRGKEEQRGTDKVDHIITCQRLKFSQARWKDLADSRKKKLQAFISGICALGGCLSVVFPSQSSFT